eukprot:NODE_1590_length_1284_cov_90.887640_g1575_i0.p1 GENE.NODE_1590_length_1284_cov_90.887640_g1575_i0~~NODE_1590_length_1284_cov_90.887640_g1575_i0.p1  ORF type:complete len:342 (+),score=25.52 NODE_1590_length_1284_cov_90.887640_g1575_i0:129-1154(+)
MRSQWRGSRNRRRASRRVTQQIPRHSRTSPRMKRPCQLHNTSRRATTEEKHLHLLAHAAVAAERVADGTSGTYFVSDENDHRAVFKPFDEELGQRNNPWGHTTKGHGSGVPPGRSWLRERLAFLLDHQGFARVPTTVHAEMPGELFDAATPKYGSLQQFVRSTDGDAVSAEDLPLGTWSADDVHRIAVFDLRMLNCDRHASNLLAPLTPTGRQLIPIDHGNCLPLTLKELCYDWYLWPQTKELCNPDTVAYIGQLDAFADARVLKRHGVADHAITLFIAATLALQVGIVECNQTVRTVAAFFLSQLDSPSQLELALQAACDGTKPDWPRFCDFVRDRMRTM